MDAQHTPGPDYAKDAYTACLYGRADARQQQSAANQIALLHGLKGELLDALRGLNATESQIVGGTADSIVVRLPVAAIQAAAAAIAKAVQP